MIHFTHISVTYCRYLNKWWFPNNSSQNGDLIATKPSDGCTEPSKVENYSPCLCCKWVCTVCIFFLKNYAHLRRPILKRNSSRLVVGFSQSRIYWQQQVLIAITENGSLYHTRDRLTLLSLIIQIQYGIRAASVFVVWHRRVLDQCL